MSFRVRQRAIDAAIDALAARGYELTRKPRRLIRSQHQLQMTVEYLIPHLISRLDHPVRIVQVGAFDGRTNDPLADAIERFACRAVLVEPQPGPFERLAETYAGDERVSVVNAAIDSQDGVRDFFTVDPKGMPDEAQQLASFDRGTIEKHRTAFPGLRIQVTKVPTISFNTLLANSGLDGVDLLQIDAEGYDLEILRMFDVPRRLPAIINWEHAHLSTADRGAAVDLVVSAGYRVAMSRGVVADSVAYREVAEKAQPRDR